MPEDEKDIELVPETFIQTDEGEDTDIVQEYKTPEDVEPVEMTEEKVDEVVTRLESNGFEEGIHFLVDEDGRIMCTSSMDKKALVKEGLKIGDLR